MQINCSSAVPSCRKELRHKLEGWASPSSLICFLLFILLLPILSSDLWGWWGSFIQDAVEWRHSQFPPCKVERNQALSPLTVVHKDVTISKSPCCCLRMFKRNKRAGGSLGDCVWKLAQDTPEAEYIPVEKNRKISHSCLRVPEKLPQACTSAVLTI